MSNYLYVANPTIDVVRVFNLANDAFLPGWGFTGVDAPYDVALQLPTGYFYVSQWAGNAGTIVKAFARGENTFDPELSLSGVTGPWGVAVSPANGAVYVTDAPDDVHVYPSVTSSVTGVDPPTGPVTGGTTVTSTGRPRDRRPGDGQRSGRRADRSRVPHHHPGEDYMRRRVPARSPRSR